MKKINLLILMVFLATGTSMAQFTYKGGADVLGAHNGYGRGCVMCHAPHSGSAGNGKGVSTDPQNGMTALWGESLTPLYGATLAFGGGSFSVTLPSIATATTNPTTGVTTWSSGVNTSGLETTVLLCLSCHDGVSTKVAMMQNQTVEPLPIVGGNAPTLLATAAPAAGAAYNNDHPVGGSATVGCNGSVGGGPASSSSESGHNWDCTGGGSGTTKITAGPNMTIFKTNYPGSFWNSASYPLSTAANGNVNAVGCTTCHNQHSMTAYANGTSTTLPGATTPTSVYPTMFFIKGWYNPLSNGNSVAQFCRNCHGGESNEMNGVLNVPTT